MSTQQIAALIDAPVGTHDPWAYANYHQMLAGQMETGPTVGMLPDDGPGVGSVVGADDFSRYGQFSVDPVGDSLDGQVVGHSGPSLDGSPTVAYRGDKPGFGNFNDQPMFSGDTNFAPGVDPSAEVGTGKPPGWVAAHFPTAEGINPSRASYALQGMFADGGEYFHTPDEELSRSRGPGRVPWWPATQDQPGQDPGARAMWPGSAVIETAQSMSISQLLGRITGNDPGWGVQ